MVLFLGTPCLYLIALLNLSVLGLFIFCSMTKLKVHSREICYHVISACLNLFIWGAYISKSYIKRKKGAHRADTKRNTNTNTKIRYTRKLVQRPNISYICVIEKMHRPEFDISPVNSHVVSSKLERGYLNKMCCGVVTIFSFISGLLYLRGIIWTECVAGSSFSLNSGTLGVMGLRTTGHLGGIGTRGKSVALSKTRNLEIRKL